VPVTDGIGDIGLAKQSVASGNELSASAKASLVDVSGSTLNFGDITRPNREPFLTASLRARMHAKKQNILVDSAISNIEKVESSDMDAAAKDAVIATLNRSLAHQLNLEDVMDKAVSLSTLREDANPDDLKPEWADEFAEHAGSKYDSDAQEIWARLLAGELNSPGTFSRKAMRVLDDMESEDARAFETLCERCAGGILSNGTTQDPFPFFIGRNEELEMSSDSLIRLKDLGLINFDDSNEVRVRYTTTIGADKWQIFKIAGTEVLVQFPPDKAQQFEVRTFTRYGIELSQLCHLGSLLEKNSFFINKFISLGARVALVSKLNVDGSAEMKVLA
jgi:hypothetical protein